MNTEKRCCIKILREHRAKHAELIDFGDRPARNEDSSRCVSCFTPMPSRPPQTNGRGRRPCRAGAGGVNAISGEPRPPRAPPPGRRPSWGRRCSATTTTSATASERDQHRHRGRAGDAGARAPTMPAPPRRVRRRPAGVPRAPRAARLSLWAATSAASHVASSSWATSRRSRSDEVFLSRITIERADLHLPLAEVMPASSPSSRAGPVAPVPSWCGGTRRANASRARTASEHARCRR